jgi:hypothetical protein
VRTWTSLTGWRSKGSRKRFDEVRHPGVAFGLDPRNAARSNATLGKLLGRIPPESDEPPPAHRLLGKRGSTLTAFSVPPEAERFVRLTAPLGVLEVRRAYATRKALLIFVRSDTTADELDDIRILAAIEWPGAPVAVARRVSMSDSGPRPVIREADDGDASDTG